MASPTYSSRGQAIVELTIVTVTILLLITAAVSLTATLRAELKHSFIKSEDSKEEATLPENIEGLKSLVRFFPNESQNESLLKLRQSGWSEDRRLKTPTGLVVLLNGPNGHMGLIETGRRRVGVFYK
jgi:hypothetical protein